MAGAGAPGVRRRGTGAAARRRNHSLEARLAHPIFDGVRRWLGGERSLAHLNALAEERSLATESGRAVRFVAPGAKDAYYEVQVYETGRVQTRPDSLHDYFNAMAWLAFPRTKARINAMHAAQIPLEGGRRGRLRDLLTIFDEGGAIVHCDDEALLSLMRNFEWKRLLWENRDRVRQAMRVVVVGHAVLEQALEPYLGITCKSMVVGRHADSDSAAHAWLQNVRPGASPRILAPLPVLGLPGWHAGSARAEFYDDQRYFRPAAVKSRLESARQPLGASTEESPGSAERDAG
jgi:hypothetical protein